MTMIDWKQRSLINKKTAWILLRIMDYYRFIIRLLDL